MTVRHFQRLKHQLPIEASETDGPSRNLEARLPTPEDKKPPQIQPTSNHQSDLSVHLKHTKTALDSVDRIEQIQTKFTAGFSECARQTKNLLESFADLNPAVKERLKTHLSVCLTSLGQNNKQQNTFQTNNPISTSNKNNTESNYLKPITVQSCINNDNIQLPDSTQQCMPNININRNRNSSLTIDASMRSLRLLPTHLPNGDLAFVLPSTYCGDACQEQPVAQVAESSDGDKDDIVWRPW